MRTFAIVSRTLLVCAYFLISFSITSCEKGAPENSDKEILSFSLTTADGSLIDTADMQATIQGHTITITVPAGTDVTRITPVFVIKGVRIAPASGVTQNFSQPVAYTVTAADGSTAVYTVSIKAKEAQSIVYIGSGDNNFYALDALTGSLKWKYSGTASFAYSSATYANGTVYVGGIDSYVYAFNALTGAVKWRFLTGSTGIESDAVVVDGTVYVGCNDDYLYALDAATGQEKWRYLTGSNISSSPTVANGVVYFGSSDSKLYALDARTGALKWSYTTGGMLNQSGPSLVNNVVYVGSRDGYLYAIDAANGSLKWSFSANGISLEQSSPTVANGVVYIGGWYDVPGFARKGSMYAVNAQTGGLVWEKLLNTGISSSPTVANGRLFITADDLNLHALDATTGATLWQKQILANSASAGVSDGIVYVGGGGTGFIYAFEAASGAEKWRFKVSGLMTSCPLIVTGNKADYAGDSGLAY